MSRGPPLLPPWTLPGKIFYLARTISLFVLLALAIASAQILGLVLEGAESPAVVVVLVVVAAAGMAYILVSFACLATRRLPSLVLIWAVDLLLSGGLLALVVLVGVEVTGACDVGGPPPFGVEEGQRGEEVCEKLRVAWVLGMAGGGLFVVSGVTVGVVSCTSTQAEEGGGGDGEMGWGVEGWRLEEGWRLGDLERGREGGGYPVGEWAREVSEATSGLGDGGDGGRVPRSSRKGREDGGYDGQTPGPRRRGREDGVHDNRTPRPRRGHGNAQGHHRPLPPQDQEPPPHRTSISSTLSRTFEYNNTRPRRPNAAQPPAQPNTPPTQTHRPQGRCLTDRATQPQPEAESSSDSAARSPGAVARAREVARRTLEGEVDGLPECGIETVDKKSLPSRAAKAPTAAARESWESWETDRRCTSSDESDSGVDRGARNVHTPDRQIPDPVAVHTPDRQIPDPVAVQGTGAPSRPRVRRVRSGERLSGILRRPALPHLLGMQSKRASGNSGRLSEDGGGS